MGRPFPSVSVRVARFEPGVSGYEVLAEADGNGTCTATPGCEDQVGGLRESLAPVCFAVGVIWPVHMHRRRQCSVGLAAC